MIEKPKLFVYLKEFWVTMVLLSFLLGVRLFLLYGDYETFKSKPFFYTQVEVIQAYEKWSGDRYYTILKLYSPTLHLDFFSRTRLRAEDITSQLRLKLFPHKDMRFVDYLGTSFINSHLNEVIEEPLPHLKDRLLWAVEEQHTSTMLTNFYQAIFFAMPLEKELRERVTALGVSHLIALSGFHLAILSGLLFFLMRQLYRPLQQRYFPYRFDLYDVGFMVLVLLAWYLWFVGSPPSLIRSYMMMLVGWLLLVFGMELLSFTFLATIVMVLLVIFPKLLLSLAFWFSVVGVFYIFLLLHYFSHLNKYLITLLITFGIFMLMLPVVHLIFPLVTPLQLLSPFISLLFTFFYPLSMGLHLVGQGMLLDEWLLKLFDLESVTAEALLPFGYGLAYMVLSFLAIYSRYFFYGLSLLSLLYTVWLFMGFWV
jgi:competence protein ComEC